VPGTVELFAGSGPVRAHHASNGLPRREKKLHPAVVAVAGVRVPRSFVPVDAESLREPPSRGVPAVRDTERQNERSFRSRDNYAAVPMFGDESSTRTSRSGLPQVGQNFHANEV